MWATPWGVADRLLHLTMQSAWCSTGNTTELSGHAYGHLQHLRRTRGFDQTEQAPIIDAVQLISACRFNDWPHAQQWRDQALRRLPISLSASMYADGSPKDSPAQLYNRLWCTALAQASMQQNKENLPPLALDALARGTGFLVDLCGPWGELPLLGDPPPNLGKWSQQASIFTLAHLVHQWLGVSCPRPADPDPDLARLGGGKPTGEPWPKARFWTAHAWHAAGLAVAHNSTHHIIGRSTDQSIWWTMNREPIVHGSGTNCIHEPTPLQRARTDDRTVRMNFGGRAAVFEGNRLTVRDAPSDARRRWTFPVGTQFTKLEQGYRAETPLADLVIKTSSHWEVDEHCLVLPTLHTATEIRIEAR